MTTAAEHIAAIREALEAGPTPGEWTVWEERVSNKADAAAELVYQVECTEDFAGAVYLLNAGGKCPAETGCGPTSKVNASYIASCNPVAMTAVLAELDRLKAENERMREALEPFADIAGEAWADKDGWTEAACQKDRIVDWFGPSAFHNARAALKGDAHGN
ncbi:MAG: hypothetical protein DI589_11190 [Shinella sp.]|nr:MAG: hypothetical protein DI589_11190 [Shinella sp.]